MLIISSAISGSLLIRSSEFLSACLKTIKKNAGLTPGVFLWSALVKPKGRHCGALPRLRGRKGSPPSEPSLLIWLQNVQLLAFSARFSCPLRPLRPLRKAFTFGSCGPRCGFTNKKSFCAHIINDGSTLERWSVRCCPRFGASHPERGSLQC